LRWRGLGTLAIALAALVPLEHLSPLEPNERMPIGDAVPQVYRWLARSHVRAVAELPAHRERLLRKDSLDEYFSTYHLKPIIGGGLVPFPPPLSRLLREVSRTFPEETSLQVFQRVGVDTVVVHHGVGSGRVVREVREAEQAQRLALKAHFSGPG